MQDLWGTGCGKVLLSEAPGPGAGESEGKNWSKEAFEEGAQLQAGAGNGISPETAFEEVTGQRRSERRRKPRELLIRLIRNGSMGFFDSAGKSETKERLIRYNEKA